MSEPTASTLRPLDVASVHAWLRRSATLDEPAWLHAEVARRMVDRLQFIRMQPRSLLEWWGRNGASTALLAQTYPKAQHLLVEPTPALSDATRRELASPWWSWRRWGKPQAQVLSAAEVPPASVQLVWANMMLHAVADPAATFARWHQALEVEGFVMFSCLGPGTLRSLRELYARMGWPSPMAELVDMHDLGDMLVHAGFADPVMDQEVLSLTWADAEAVLRELRTLGANASPDRHAGLRTPRWRQRLLDGLWSLAGPDGRIQLEFEVAYGHAFKPVPRASLSAETRVSLDDMRTMVRTKAHRG